MTENRNEIPAVAPEKLVYITGRELHHDKPPETKPRGYFADAMYRFTRNKGSVVAAFIILLLVLYALLVPLFFENAYTRRLTDTLYLSYTKLPPKMPFGLFGQDGCSDKTVNAAGYAALQAIEEETGVNPIVKTYASGRADASGSKKTTYYDLRVDNYAAMGMMYMTFTPSEYEALQAWQDEHQLQVIYPAVKDAKQTDANIWYEADRKGAPKLDKQGQLVPAYRAAAAGDESYHSLRIAADSDPEKPLAYARVTGTSEKRSYVARVSKAAFFRYRYGFTPSFVFGTNDKGQDIFTRLAHGARFSFLLAICISAINLLIGAVYGAVEGYYGGAVDLVMERVSDVLSGVPFMVVTTLFQLHLANKVGVVPALLFAFVLTGWIGMASMVRMQFYRYKGQEYVLAARTMGAGDRRIMFGHIFPNAIGTIITGSVLSIPGVIFSESSLTYLGIINLESGTLTSVGTMLASGKAYLSTDPYIIFFPALFIALLEISFNLFGNGLRDAFNPSLRGYED